jgi:hypothetical protein
MKPRIFLTSMIILILCCLSSKSSLATNLRGKIIHHTANGDIPASNVRVDLMIFNNATHVWQDVSSVVTGADGFYYFLNFSPNQLFYVSVGGKFYPPQQTPLSIQSINPSNFPYYEDIPPILI